MKPQPKTVRAWACAVSFDSGEPRVDVAHVDTEDQALHAIEARYPYDVYGDATFGPVVRIEVPAPKERKS